MPARSRLSVNHMNNMGIDIYARWEGQLPDQVEKQLEVWLSGVDGGAGYLREAYHGEPYALCERVERESGVPVTVVASW